jgi:hypothetical protein
MPHSESAWRAELQAHNPQSCDHSELSLYVPDVSSWRVLIGEEPELKDCLETWESFIQANHIAVLIEQASDDGALADESEIASRLEGCPAEWTGPFDVFVRSAPDPVRDYLVHACYCLVQIERERRTGNRVWRSEAPSGSTEVLRELMFKWGARHHRHRWTW